MKKTLCLILLLVACSVGWAQTVVTGAGSSGSGITQSATVPATCTVGSVYFHTTTTGGAIGLYECRATNTWSGPPTVGGGITNGAGINVLMKSDGANAVASLASDNGTTLSYTGTGGGSFDHITTTGTAGAMTTTAIAAPATPAAGKGAVYVDSTSKNIAVKNDAGTVNHGIQTVTCTNQVLTAVADAGSSTCTTLTTAYLPAVSAVVDTSTPITVSTTLNAEMHFNEHATAATAMVYNLPTAAAGKQFCFANAYNGSAANTGTVKLVPSATGQFIIFTDGTLTTNTTGYVISGGAAGDAGCVVGVDSTHWILYVQRGTWTKA